MIAFDFEFLRPKTPEEAYTLWHTLETEGKKAMYYSGGSELVTAMRKGSVKAEALIDLKGLEVYMGLGEGKSPLLGSEAAVWMGGGLSLGTLAETFEGTLLAEVARGIADHTVRNTLTVGGNICGRLPYREMALALLTLEAEVVTFGPVGLSRRPLHEAFHKRLALEAGEFLLGFELAPEVLKPGGVTFYRKRRQKQLEIDYPICHTVVVRRGDAFRAAVAGVSSYVWYVEKTAGALKAGIDPLILTERVCERLEPLAAEDTRGSKAYKLALMKADLLEAFTRLGDSEGSSGKAKGISPSALWQGMGTPAVSFAGASAYSGLGEMVIALNGSERTVAVRPSDTLLTALRQSAGHTGAKPGCENGDCGACTVLLEGRPVKACLMLAVEADRRRVTTVEGLKETAIQRAFEACGGFQCGYCTSGFLVNAWAMLEAHPDASEAVQREWLAANLCRCTGYEGIRGAVEQAKDELANARRPKAE